MQGGSAGASAVLIGRAGVGLWGAAKSKMGYMTTYRHVLTTLGRRQLHTRPIFRPCRTKFKSSKQNTSSQKGKAEGTNGVNTSRWNLLVLLFGRGRHGELVEELKEFRYALRYVTRQFEIQTAERIRRSIQLYSVYSRLWGEEAARTLINSLRRMIIARGKNMLLSAVCFSQYDWKTNKISTESLKSSVKDLDSVPELCRNTVECEDCGKRQVIDQQMDNVKYCTCNGTVSYTDKSRVYDSWEPFIERKHHIVWRKRHRVHQNLYAYKVHGTYDDISLSAFMEVQLNSNFRTEWDDTALQLRVLESHKDSNSDLIYWLVKYPHFFANRDYIYKRRFLWNEDKQEVVIMNVAISPDHVPEEKGVHRVNEYWSTMVIRAKEDANKPGLEYTLTYFDNPGTSLPEWLTNFIAVSGFPSFLEKVHEAAVSLQAVHEKGEDVYISLPNELRYPTQALERPSLQVPTDMEISEKEDSRLIAGQEQLEIAPLQTEGELFIIEDSISVNTGIEHDISEESMSCTKSSENDKAIPTCEYVETEEEFVTDRIEVQPDELGQIVGESKASIEKTKVTNTDDGTMSSEVDKAFFVRRGDKEVAVDLLEAMEVVAPELDKQTTLSKKVEKLTMKAWEEIQQKTVFIDKLSKFRTKLRLFHENASQKKETSMKEMHELEKRTHYEHYDDQTQKHVEKLFQAMREVLQADKDMRTGKGLLDDSSEYDIYNKSKYDTRDSYQSSSFTKRKVPSTEGKLNDKSFSGETPDSFHNKKSNNSTRKKSKSPDDPPPPPPPPLQPLDSSEVSEIPVETGNDKESTNNELETCSSTSSLKTTKESSSSYSSWKSWIYIPYITAWWDAEESEVLRKHTQQEESIDVSGKRTQLEEGGIETTSCCDDHKIVQDDTVSYSLASQVWYIVGLGWVFHTNSEVNVNSDAQSEENISSKYQSNTINNENSSWYWYPVNATSRLYAWAFKSSKENV